MRNFLFVMYKNFFSFLLYIIVFFFFVIYKNFFSVLLYIRIFFSFLLYIRIFFSFLLYIRILFFFLVIYKKLFFSFLLYVRNLPWCSERTGPYLYVEDWVIMKQHKENSEIEKVLIREFSDLCQWFIANKSSSPFGELILLSRCNATLKSIPLIIMSW